MDRIAVVVAFVSVLAGSVLLGGCRAEECQKMLACCEEIKDVEGVGSACGEMAQGVKDPDTCRTILKTARAMFEKRGEEVPKACRK